MEYAENNREVVSTIGDLIEALYCEIDSLPLSDAAKSAMVTIMLGDIVKRKGRMIYFNAPIRRSEVAA